MWVHLLKNEEATYRGTEKNTEWIQQLQNEQRHLGLPQMWTGFISQSWGDIQEHYHWRERHDQSYTGKRWATNVVQSLWTCALHLWRKRVHWVHKDTKQVHPHRKALHQQVKTLYQKLKQIPNILAGLFKHNPAQLQEKPTKYLMR